jgi:hypothetical protein
MTQAEIEAKLNELDKRTLYPLPLLFQKAIENVDFDVLKVKLLRGGAIMGGSSSVLPGGWTITNPGTGHYTITHNLGTTSYSVTANSAYGAGGGMIAIVPIANSFDVYVYNETGTALINATFYFTLIKT